MLVAACSAARVISQASLFAERGRKVAAASVRRGAMRREFESSSAIAPSRPAACARMTMGEGSSVILWGPPGAQEDAGAFIAR